MFFLEEANGQWSLSSHTIPLSDDGTVHSFGKNNHGELGLGHNNDVYLPTSIPNLPKINMVSCGFNFTVCVDYEGFIWSFGDNYYGQLGTGNKTNFNVPQKLLNISPALSISCGFYYTLMITNDSNLWSWGRNEYGQLCHGDKEDRSKPQKTSFSNISKISTSWDHSLFQNKKGEIFVCGDNDYVACGLISCSIHSDLYYDQDLVDQTHCAQPNIHFLRNQEINFDDMHTN